MARANEFENQATAGRTGIVSEFWGFLKTHKKWWLTPLLLVLLVLGGLVVLAGTGAAPFIYSLF